MNKAVRGRKGDGKEHLLICWSAFSDENGNSPLDTLVVYFEQ
jgi:hypothetical protein